MIRGIIVVTLSCLLALSSHSVLSEVLVKAGNRLALLFEQELAVCGTVTQSKWS